MLAAWTASVGAYAAEPADIGLPAAPDASLPAPTPLTASQTVYLDVTLNRTPRGLHPFTDLQGRLQATPATLRQLGFSARFAAPTFLDQLPGASVRYDSALQTLELDVPLDLLDLETTQAGRSQIDAPQASASPGALLNYDLYASRSEGLANVALTSEVRLFGLGRGTFVNSALTRTFQPATGERWRSESVRLDSRWQLDLPDPAISVVVGDLFTGFLDWSRSTRLGGIQIGRNYALQPYRILTPTPSFLGEATMPSNIELYVDGLQQYSGAVPVGPFQLAAQPGISGAGTAQVVITDAFGRMQTLDFSFYGTQQLLARGLSDWSLEVGHLREQYGVRSFAYDQRTLASGTWRRGVSDGFTAEAHAEGGGGVSTAGLGGLWLVGRAGVVSAAYASSHMDGLRGGQYSLGYSWNSRRYNLNLLTRRTHGDYRDLGALQGNLAPSVSEQATFGMNLDRLGALSASYLRLDYPQGPRSRYASLFWSRTWAQRWSGYLSVNQNLDDSDDRSIYLSLSISLDRNRQGIVSAQRNGDRQVVAAELMQPVPGEGSGNGFGWRLQARQGDDNGGLAEIGALGPYGRYSAGIASQGGGDFAYASASGSLVWMQGSTFAAREISDAFAVVSTGYGDVPVMLENRPIGTTDRRGKLLVTPLLSWQRNRLSIDTMALPADVRADRVEAIATPRQGAGIGVDFGLHRVRSVILTAQDAQGQPLPVGSRASRDGVAIGVIGYDGQLYVEGLQADNVIQVDTETGSCVLRFAAPAEGVRRLGPLSCQAPETP